MKTKVCTLSVLVAVIWLLPSLAQAVDCDAGESLQAAINAAAPTAAPVTITVTGTCNENVGIRENKHRLTLDGQGIATINGPNATTATVGVQGAGIIIRGFTITGGRNGVLLQGTASIDTNTIQNTGSNGISVNQGGSARIVNNIIQNNPNTGIVVSENSSARIGFRNNFDTVASPNTIQNNGEHGIIVTRSSTAGIVGNTISNNGLAAGSDGIIVTRASQADISSNTIDGNGGDGIFLNLNSVVNLGEDMGTTIFDLPNSTTVGLENGNFGIRCVTGGAAHGRQGTLNGTSGPASFAGNCTSSLIP